MTKPVLVTSAAGGRQGKTGRHVSEMLLARGIPVRAFVHAIDERSEHLWSLGAEIFEGDFLDARAVQLIGSVISLKDIIATFGRVLARDVRYEETTDEEWRSDAVARGYNAHALAHLSALWKALRAASLSAEAARFAVTDTIEKIGGARPKSFEQFVREGLSEGLAKTG